MSTDVLGQPDVDDLRVAAIVDHHVLGGQVAVHPAGRVQRVEGGDHAREVEAHRGEWEALARLGPLASENLLEVTAT
jgi:hypothetical protein